MKKSIKISYIVIFAVCICAIHMIFFVCKNYVDTNNYENRNLYEAPVVGETPITEFSQKFEQFYNDRIPFRNQFISLNNRLNYYLFKSTTGDQVLIGKEGWLFIKDKTQGNAIANYTGEDLLSEEELAAIATNLMANKEYVENLGKEFVVFISPNKSRVYSEYMPDYLGEPAEEYSVLQIINYLQENTDINIVYDLDALMEAKEDLADESVDIYHKADTHWNMAGAYVGTRELIIELGGDIPAITDEQIQIEPIQNTESDLANMLHMTNDFINKENDYSISGYNRNNVTLVQDDFNQVIEYTSDAVDTRTIYMVRDSFATAMGEYLGSQFSRVYMRHNSTYSNEDFLSVDADVCVLEIAERGVAYQMSVLQLWN